jgi:hypothetical protein
VKRKDDVRTIADRELLFHLDTGSLQRLDLIQ